MPRPTKNNCAYFPHDNDMRNHAKVKSIHQVQTDMPFGLCCLKR